MSRNAAIREKTSDIHGTQASVFPTTQAQGESRIQNQSDLLLEKLNSLLADEFAIFTKTLNYHWNVTGPRFYSVHEFLEGQYRSLLETIDEVAERIRKLDSKPIGTLREFFDRSSIVERPGECPGTSQMISDLATGHGKIQKDIRFILKDSKKLNLDPGTEDFLTGLLKKHEEMTWMLKSTLN